MLHEYARGQFEYGVLDCILFVSKVVTAITGIDYVDIQYHGSDEAYAILKQRGGLEELITSKLGSPVSIRCLDDGDPVLCKLPIIGEVVGIIVNGSILLKTKGDTVKIPMDRILKGWHVCLAQ